MKLSWASVWNQGLSTLLAGQTQKCRPHRLDFSGTPVDVLPGGGGGQRPADPISLLSSPRFSQLIQRCKEHYDLIIVDTYRPCLGMADALKVGAVCDGTVLVARLDRITQPTLTEVVAVLDPIQVLGLVANGAKAQPNRYPQLRQPCRHNRSLWKLTGGVTSPITNFLTPKKTMTFPNALTPQASLAQSNISQPQVASVLACNLLWRQDKIVVTLADDTTDFVLPALADDAWFRTCLVKSKAKAVCIDSDMGQDAIHAWA